MPVPDVDQICVEDVAYALSNLCRCNGHTTPFFSVLQHSVEVSVLSERVSTEYFDVDEYEAGLAGLLHDAPEYVVGDVTSPLKRRLGDAYRKVYAEVETNVYRALGVTEIAKRCHEVVKYADSQMLASDMFRWKVYGTIVDCGRGKTFDLVEDGELPPGYDLHFADAKPWVAGEGVDVFLCRYYSLKAKIEWRKIHEV